MRAGEPEREEENNVNALTTAERAALRHKLEGQLDAALERAGLDPTSATVRAIRDAYALEVREDGTVSARLDLDPDRPIETLAARIVAERGPAGEQLPGPEVYAAARASAAKSRQPRTDWRVAIGRRP